MLPDLTLLASVSTVNVILAPCLTRLDLSNNALITLPPWIFGMVVGADGGGGTPRVRDRLASASSGVVKPNGGSLGKVTFAPRLSILRVCGNRLRSVPRQMWLARQLQCLDLSANSLTELPRASIEEVLSAAVLRSESPPDPVSQFQVLVSVSVVVIRTSALIIVSQMVVVEGLGTTHYQSMNEMTNLDLNAKMTDFNVTAMYSTFRA